VSEDFPNGPELSERYGCVAWALWYAAGGCFAIALYGVLLGALSSNAVALGIGVAALVPGILVGRHGLRRLRAIWAAQRRVEEWRASRPGGREALRARFRRAALTAGVGSAGILLYLLAVEPLVTVTALVGTVVVLLPFLPHIRRQTRWYRELTAAPGVSHQRVRRRRS
jgi:hypothetical protein